MDPAGTPVSDFQPPELGEQVLAAYEVMFFCRSSLDDLDGYEELTFWTNDRAYQDWGMFKTCKSHSLGQGEAPKPSGKHPCTISMCGPARAFFSFPEWSLNISSAQCAKYRLFGKSDGF